VEWFSELTSSREALIVYAVLGVGAAMAFLGIQIYRKQRADEFARLADLHRQGILTDEEYRVKRKELHGV
jgi:hypothetical protein